MKPMQAKEKPEPTITYYAESIRATCNDMDSEISGYPAAEK
jgi:hypothetical protein